MAEGRWVGKWWLPDKPDRKIGGVLEVDAATGVHLELTDELLRAGRADLVMTPLLLGAAAGRNITLLECRPANGGHTVIAQTTTTTEVVRARVAIVGIHLKTPDEAVFDGVEVTISGLTAWANTSGLRTALITDAASNERAHFSAAWSEPVETALTEPAVKLGLHWKIILSGMTPKLTADHRYFGVEESVALRVESEQPRPWDSLLGVTLAVRDLVTVATQRPAWIKTRTLLIKQDGIVPDYHVDLYFMASGADQNGEQFDESDVIFTLADVCFSEVMNKWFALREVLGLSLGVLLGLDYQVGGYYENRLFNAASAAEGFHTALCPQTTGLDPQVYEAVKQQVKDALAATRASPRDWVMNRLGDNRPGLKDRYLELATKADADAVTALLTDIDTWAKWLKDARNALGHLNTGALQSKVPEGARYRLEYVTRALLHLVIIAELGISPERQREVVQQNWSYSAAEFSKAVAGVADRR